MIEQTVDNKNKNISVSIELVVPKHQFNTMEFAEKFHNQFVGNPDYVESNIIVHDDGNQHTGATIIINDLEDYDRMKKELMEAIQDVFQKIEDK